MSLRANWLSRLVLTGIAGVGIAGVAWPYDASASADAPAAVKTAEGCPAAPGANPSPTAGPALESIRKVADAAACSAPRSVSFIAGRRVEYDVDYVNNSSIDFGRMGEGKAASAQKSTFVTRVSGRVVMTVLDVAASGDAIVLFRATGARVSFLKDGQEQVETSRPALKALEAGWVAHLHADGTVAALQAPSGEGTSRSFVRNLASWMQVALPADGLCHWSVSETDSQGTGVAAYAAKPGPGESLVIRKSRHRDGSVFMGQLVGGANTDIALELDSTTGLPASIDGVETTVPSEFASGSARFSAKRVSEASVDPDKLEAELSLAGTYRRAPSFDLSTPEMTSGALLSIEKQRLQGATLTQLQAALANRKRASDAKTYFQVRAYAILNPDRIRQLAAPLFSANPAAPAVTTLVGALAGAGTPEAQHVLVEALTARRGVEPVESAILMSLGQVEHPSLETVAAVYACRKKPSTSDAAGAAALAIGTMASSLAADFPARSEHLIDLELARLPFEEGNLPQLRLTMGALGNAGSDRALPDLVKLSRSGTAEIRGMAAWAMRLIDRPEAQKRILSLLADDSEISVRSQALQAVALHDLSADAVATLRSRADVEPDQGIREAIGRLLKKNDAAHERS